MNQIGDRRNPYLVLGLSYGSPVQDVKRAFARRAKEVAKGTFTAYGMEDLTWALRQLEQSELDTDIDVTFYRVPANQSLFTSSSHNTVTDAQRTESDPQTHLEDALSAVLKARWDEALTSAKRVLTATENEDLRDEALNLLACAQWQLGDDDRAISALRQALEGAYNASLQTNIGVVAANLAPALAAEHLGRLSHEAPAIELRLGAAMRGFNLWHASLDEDDESPAPATLRDALRSLAKTVVSSGDLSDDDVWSLLTVLSQRDSDWLKINFTASGTRNSQYGWPSPPTAPNTCPSCSRSVTNGANFCGHCGHALTQSDSTNTRSQMVAVALARAEGPVEYVEAVGQLSASDSQWCADQRDSVVDLVCLIQNQDPASAGSAVMGMTLLETDIALPPAKAVQIRCLAIIGVCSYLPEDQVPSNQVQDYMPEVKTILDRCSAEEQLDLRELFELTGTGLLLSVANGTVAGLNTVSGHYNDIIEMFRYRRVRRRDKRNLGEVLEPLRAHCREVVNDLNRLMPYTKDDDVRGHAKELIEMAQGLINGMNAMVQ